MKSPLAVFVTRPPSAEYYYGLVKPPIKWIVIHTAEGPVGNGAAKQLAKWSAQERYFPDGKKNTSSWHYAIDNVEIASCLDESFAGHHTGASKVDYQALGFELCLKVAGDWKSKIYLDTVDNAAKLTADRCRQYKIPLKLLTLDELKAGQPGIISHNLVRLTKWGRTTHTDPGPNFPWSYFLDRVIIHAEVPAPPTQPKPPVTTAPPPQEWTDSMPMLKLGSSSPHVKDIQTFFGLTVDGVFGVNTDAAVRRWQVNFKLPVDGIVGPKTWKTLLTTVGKGDKNGAVRIVQRRLGLTIDGVYGSKTDIAVRRFQTVAKLTVDGIVGPNTWRRLLPL